MAKYSIFPSFQKTKEVNEIIDSGEENDYKKFKKK